MSLDCPYGHKKLTWRSSSVKRARLKTAVSLRTLVPRNHVALRLSPWRMLRMQGAASSTCTTLYLKAASSVWQRQGELVRGPQLLENTVVQEVGAPEWNRGAVLHLVGLAGRRGTARGPRPEGGTETETEIAGTGSATETERLCIAWSCRV